MREGGKKELSSVEESVNRPGKKGEHSMKPTFSALIGVALQISQPSNRQRAFRLVPSCRSKLASIKVLRSSWYLAIALRDVLQWRPVTQSKYTEIFTARTDPFGYEVSPFEFEKYEAATELLNAARNDAYFERAWEIGCAEGVFTARLAPLCERLSAVDFVPLVLDRARSRCQEFTNISFTKWDLKSDPAPSFLELIVIMDVFGSLGGRRDIRRARDKVVRALVPGGYLLYGDCLGDLYRRRIEDSWWARLLLRGPRNIHRLIAAHPALVEVARRETSMHLLALFRKRL
jgi:SAM-dependent methyltransferase